MNSVILIIGGAWVLVEMAAMLFEGGALVLALYVTCFMTSMQILHSADATFVASTIDRGACQIQTLDTHLHETMSWVLGFHLDSWRLWQVLS